jgi:DAN domain.
MLIMVLVLLLLSVITEVISSNDVIHDVQQKQRCQLQGFNLDVKLPTCRPVTVEISTCLGACISCHTPFSEGPQGAGDEGDSVDRELEEIKLKENVWCCKVAEYVEVTLALSCRIHKQLYHTIKSATACSCQRC